MVTSVGSGAMSDQAAPVAVGDHRLTGDLIALFDITRDCALEVEYQLRIREHAAADPHTRAELAEQRAVVRRRRRRLPLGTGLAARRELIALQDGWVAEAARLRG